MNKIVLRGLSKAYGNKCVLHKINLEVAQGEIYGIIGMSGAGKSTLIRLLTLLEKPTEGTVTIAGDEITALSKSALCLARQKIGMIFQHFNLFSSRSVLDNVTYPLEISGVGRQERVKRAHELLELVGLTEKADLFPPQLSGGQKQRVAIARALANHPSVLLCDEATSALDPQTTDDILELLYSLNQRLGLTIVMITHEMGVIKKICSKVAVLEAGEIVEEGSVVDLFTAPGHPTTQRFLQNTVHELPPELVPKGQDKEVLHLSFKGSSAQEPIVSRLIKQFEVEVNILLGSIDVLKQATVGNLIIELSGTESERARARAFLETQQVLFEVVA